MKILMLTKFPPTQGGEATKSYWIARGLGLAGHEVHIVTNAAETDAAFFVPDATDPAAHLPGNVHVHVLDDVEEFHIPFHRAFAERLSSKAIEIVEEFGVDVVEAAHLTPFGVAALVTKACTGVPVVQRHGGSDVGYLWPSRGLHTILTRVLQAADKVVVGGGSPKPFLDIGLPVDRLASFRYYIDACAFSPEGVPDPSIERDRTTLLFSGKITPGKKLIELLKVLREETKPYQLVLLPVAFSVEMVSQLCERYGVAEHTMVLPPQPCWQMPAVLRSVDLVTCLETRFTTQNHWPLFPREVLCSGTALLFAREQYTRGALPGARDGEHLLAVDPDDPVDFRQVLSSALSEPAELRVIGAAGLKIVAGAEHYDAMISDLTAIYAEAVERSAAAHV
jgi:glycosyltransferase involved in cell wall biosynthesis